MPKWIGTRPRNIVSYSACVVVCLVGGTKLLHVNSPWATFAGWAFIPYGVAALVWINLSFRRIHEKMERLERRLAQTAPEAPE